MTRSPVALSFWISLLVLATIGSLAVKDALASTPTLELSDKTNAAIAATLRRQGFAIAVEPHRFQSWIYFGTRGTCRIAARDALNAANHSEAFRVQMARIGSVRYLYRGARSVGPPELTALVYRLVPHSLDRFGIHIARSVPVAVATGPGCANSDFGLERIAVAP